MISKYGFQQMASSVRMTLLQATLGFHDSPQSPFSCWVETSAINNKILMNNDINCRLDVGSI